MSNWTMEPVKRFALEFVSAEVKLRGAMRFVEAGKGSIDRTLALQASDALAAAVDHLPLEVQGEILRVRANFENDPPTKPPVLRKKRDD
jgi:hypothetical protein